MGIIKLREWPGFRKNPEVHTHLVHKHIRIVHDGKSAGIRASRRSIGDNIDFGEAGGSAGEVSAVSKCWAVVTLDARNAFNSANWG